MGMIRPFSGGVGSKLDPKVDEWSLGSVILPPIPR